MTQMKPVIVRLAPVTNSPVIFYADSRKDGQLLGVFGDSEKKVGIDVYAASQPVTPEFAQKIVHVYAKQHNLDEHTFLVKQRLPMNGPIRKSRIVQDEPATNDSSKEEAKKVEPDYSSQTLEQRVQAFHDQNSRKGAGQKDSVSVDAVAKPQEELAKDYKHGQKADPAKATAEKPHGATVRRSDATVKSTEEAKNAAKPTKRPYKKSTKERSARSKAAFERYVSELNKTASEQLPNFAEPVKAGEGVTQEQVSDAELQFALKLVKLLKGVM